MDDDNVLEFSQARINQLKNLRGNKGKTDEEIIEILKARKPKPRSTAPKLEDYDIRFNEKLKILQDEYAVDMNNSNDVEALKSLVRHQIQLENVNRDIDALQRQDEMSKDDYSKLKVLGDFQRTVATSITELQDKLGISRKIRKEKQVDDIPQWIDMVLHKANTFFEKKTVKVECPKCMIELARFWLNFPNEKNDIDMALTCWKCKEVVMFTG